MTRAILHSARGAIVAAVTAVLWVGCTSGGESASAPEATSEGGEAPDARIEVTADAGGDAFRRPDGDADGGESDGAVDASPACVHYCDTVQSACNVENPQFPTMGACLRACTFYPPGTPSDPYENADSLHCRQLHADAAVASPLDHCHHAGPYGYGGCGSMCDAFCRTAMLWCTASAGGAPFASSAACKTECEGWAWAPTGPDGMAAYRATGPTSGNTLDCREYELVKSLESNASRDLYCPRAASSSAPCQ